MSTDGIRPRESGMVETDTEDVWNMVRELFGQGIIPKAETAASVIPHEHSARNEAAPGQRSRVVPRTTFVPSHRMEVYFIFWGIEAL